MLSPIYCLYHSYSFTPTLPTCPLKVFEFKMPALCFILTHNNHIFHVVGRIAIDLWEKSPTQTTNTMKTLAIGKFLDHQIQQVA